MRRRFTSRAGFLSQMSLHGHRLLLLCVCTLAWLPGALSAFSIFPSLTSPIREEMEDIKAELTALPVFPLNTSPWTMTYSSAQHKTPELPVTIKVTFPQSEVIDLVALMPGSFTDQRNQVQSWGFPVRFMIERVFADGNTDIIADYREEDYPKPGIDPQFFPCPDRVPTAGLRITVTEPAANTTWWRASHVVSFSELYAFVDNKNVALNAEVEASSSNEFGYLWSTKCLTDGFTHFSPLFHDVEDPENNIIGHGLEKLNVEIDLGEAHRVDQFHLWPVVHEIQHNYPPSSGIGFPSSIRLESSTLEDFSDATVIYENMNLDYRPGAGPFMHRTKPTEARYLRFTFAKGLPSKIRRPANEPRARISLTEIEVFSQGEVIS